MNLVEMITTDPYLAGLEERSQIAQNFFDSLGHNLESDLGLAEKYKTQTAGTTSFGASLDGLKINIEVERAETAYQLSVLTLSSAFSQVRVFANDPPGWIFLQISKRSAMFEGVIHFGVMEVVIHTQRDRPYELNLTRCGWLWLEGMPDKDKIRPRLIADLLWKHLLNPEVQPQLEELNKQADR